MRSRPTRARGLKPCRRDRRSVDRRVAPHAGAWIETFAGIQQSFARGVAPHAGAWIETCWFMTISNMV